MAESDTFIDVVELCGILQCLGFNVRSVDLKDKNSSMDATRTVVVDCQASGLHVVLESGNLTCSCPSGASQQNSGIWQVSGIAGGKQSEKEIGCTILGYLPKDQRDRVTKDLQNILRGIKEYNEMESDRQKDSISNRSASMIEMKTPDKRDTQLKVETPTRYRSLDTLTALKKAPESLPEPGRLLKQTVGENAVDSKKSDVFSVMCPRQSTYTLSSTPDSSTRRNKTSSPIQKAPSSVVDNLIAAEKTAEELRSSLSNIIKDLMDEGRYNSSSSLALDVSKISVKVAESTKPQFASSPNLWSGNSSANDLVKNLKKTDSASSSKLPTKSSAKEGKMAKFRRISPNLFNLKNNSDSSKFETKDKDNKTSKLNNIFKPKIVKPVRVNKANSDASPNVSASRKTFSNVKSTIPRPTPKKD